MRLCMGNCKSLYGKLQGKEVFYMGNCKEKRPILQHGFWIPHIKTPYLNHEKRKTHL